MTTWDVYLKPRINNGDKNYPKLNWCNRTILDINSISLPSANLGDILFDHADCLPPPETNSKFTPENWWQRETWSGFPFGGQKVYFQEGNC